MLAPSHSEGSRTSRKTLFGVAVVTLQNSVLGPIREGRSYEYLEMRRSREQRPDVARFVELVEDNWSALDAYCRRRVVGASDAEDVLAEVFAVAWRRLGDVPAGDEARRWLFGVAKNLVRAQRRQGDWLPSLAGRLGNELLTSPINDDHAVIVDREVLAVVESALGTMQDADRSLIELVAWRGLTHAEISLVLGCSANAVAIRLHRARQRLEAELRARDIER